MIAEKMDMEAVPEEISTPLVLRALEELRMLTQDDVERERYEARRKAQLDYNTGLKVARLEGREEGEKIGVIRFCEQLLGRAETPVAVLGRLTLEQLSALAEDLQAQLRKPPSAD